MTWGQGPGPGHVGASGSREKQGWVFPLEPLGGNQPGPTPVLWLREITWTADLSPCR